MPVADSDTPAADDEETDSTESALQPFDEPASDETDVLDTDVVETDESDPDDQESDNPESDNTETDTPETDETEIDEPMVSSRRIALIAFCLLVLYGLVNFVDVWLASRSSYEGTSTAAVVLGAAQYNGEPSAALQGRLDRAADLYLNDRVELVVVTGGGQAADITTEAKTGYDYLRDTVSIPDEDLRLEVDGASTYQSLAAVARFLSDEGIDDVILVTDPYHAKRSVLIADEVGLIAEVAPTDSSTSFGRLLQESAATAVGRLVGFRRIDAYIDV